MFFVFNGYFYFGKLLLDLKDIERKKKKYLIDDFEKFLIFGCFCLIEY